MKKIVLLAFVLVLLSTAVVVRFVRPAVGEGTIFIRSDGSVDPSTAPIQRDGNLYAFTGNIYDSIYVYRDNIVVDGAGYVLQGAGMGAGIFLSGRSNVTIKNMKIKEFNDGIRLDKSSNNSISGNNLTANLVDGLQLINSSGNRIYGNIIDNNYDYGIWLWAGSNNNSIHENNVTDSRFGIWLELMSFYNSISGNNIINNDEGIQLRESSNNTISGNNITGFYGVSLSSCSNNSIYGNNIRAYYMLLPYSVGISLSSSNNNCIYANEIVRSDYGISFEYSDSNSIFGNTIAGNGYGISLSSSSNNSIHGNYIGGNYNYNIGLWSSSGNRFYHNTIGPTIGPNPAVGLNNSTDTWDDGYPSGGNYWGGGGLVLPTDVDVKSGPYQNESGSDGIVDTPHVIDANNTDNYPLMGMFYDFTVEIEFGQKYHVYVISNSTVSNLQVLWWLTSPNEYLQPGQKFIQFYVAREEGSVGFCRLMIPRVVLNDSYTVLVDWQEVPATELPISNSTHAYLYFTYNHSMHEVVIVPEFPALASMLLTLIMLTVAIAIYKRRLLKTPIH